MSSPNDQTYVPTLESSSSQKVLLSWKLLADALADSSYDRLASPAVAAFLKDPYVHQLLKKPSLAFAPPTAQSKVDFTARTAANGYSPLPDSGFDIREIKDDAQWLSNAVKLDENTALRVVLVEFQSRAISHLSGPLSTQDVTNIQQAAGLDNTQISSLFEVIDATSVADAEALRADFDNPISRRRRILATYLSERRNFLASLDSLMTFLFYSHIPTTAPELESLRKTLATALFGLQDVTKSKATSFEDIASACLEILPGLIESPYAGQESIEGVALGEQLGVDWVRTGLVEAVHAMAVIFQTLDLSHGVFAPPSVVSSWFKFVDNYTFLDLVQGAHEQIAELVTPLRGLVCGISLKLLNTTRTLRYLDQDVDLEEHEDSYAASSDILGDIHNTVLRAFDANLVTAKPVIFAWTLILQRMYVAYQERLERRDAIQNQRAQDGFELGYRQGGAAGGRRNSAGSIVSIEKSAYDLFLVTNLGGDIQLARELALGVTSGTQLYDLIADISNGLGNTQFATFRPVIGARMRLDFLELLKLSFSVVGYQSDPVSALIAVLSAGETYWDLSRDNLWYASKDVTATALADPQLLRDYVFQSLGRYPYEFLPFINICCVLSTSLCRDERSEIVMKSLLKTPSLTLEQAQDWNGYELVHEEENVNMFRTLDDITLFTSGSTWKRAIHDEEAFVIPAGTYGRFVTDSGMVVLLEYEHSTLALLGKRLEVNLSPESISAKLGLLGPDEVAETIGFLATLLRVESLKATDLDAAAEAGLSILREASRVLPRTKDIISVVCDTFDTFIQADLADLEEGNITVLTSCLQFLDAVLPLCPGRVWAYMPRCELLNSESRAGRLSSITANLDLHAERFDFLASAIKLFSDLVDSARNSAVQRKTSTTRQKGGDHPWLGTSDKILSRVCLSISMAAVDTLENTSTWRFQSELHRSTLVRDVVTVLDNLIVYTYSTGELGAAKGLTGTLQPAAQYVVDSFLSSSSGPLRFQPLLSTLLVVLQLPTSTLYPHRSRIISERLTAAVNLATRLLKIADYQGLSSTAIQNQLFQAASLVARLCAVGGSSQHAAFNLLETLVESAGKLSNDPPSLLGYLGPQTSRSFLHVASNLDKPFDRPHTVVYIWKFFSSVLRNQQQWMANCLLTGKTPREALASDGKALHNLSEGSALSVAMRRLQAISSISSQEAIAVLDFVTSAQNFWPWTILVMQKQETDTYLTALRGYVRVLKPPVVTAKSDGKEAGFQARIAAYIAEAFAMQIYHQRKMGQTGSFAKDVINDLDYFLRHAVQVDGYNTSLHVNFARNFSSQYQGCSLDDFKRTVLLTRDLGAQYYYALDVADGMLSFDAGWVGKRQNGFRHEMETANINLSLVEAQIALFHAWEYLLLELGTCLLPQNPAVARQMLQVAEQCLEANQGPQAPETIFIRLTRSRANLSLALLQRLAECSMLPRDISQLLGSIASTIYAVENPFDEDQIPYYRTLLKILFIVLRGGNHSANAAPITTPQAPEGSVSVTQLVLTILDRVVAQGFRALVSLVHEANSPTTPEDIALITAILQACLALPGMEQCETQILNIIATHDVSHVATSLFSWADKLAEKGDPIYGELALLFLFELSALPGVAEQLACDGLLSRITSANLAGFMRRGTVSPFAENAGPVRCYGIWTKGLLPLMLNFLQALGATIAPELASVLNQFPNLMQSSLDRFEAPGLSRTLAKETPQHVTLIAVSEIHSLAMLTRVLAVLRASNNRDIPEVHWDSDSLLENVNYWLDSRKVLRERLVALSPRESEWRAMAASADSGCENRLEEKVVAQLIAVRDVLSDEAE